MVPFAAARWTLDDIAVMRATLRNMAEVADDPIASPAADARLHMAIACSSQNTMFVKLIDFLGVRLVPPRNLYLRGEPRKAHRLYVDKVRTEHEAIVDAIMRMNPFATRDAARHHMQESLSRHTELNDLLSIGKNDAAIDD